MNDIDIIRHIEREIGTKLEQVELAELRWEGRHYGLNYLGEVVGIDLNRLGLTELPDALFELSNLEFLSLSDNQLNALPPKIGDLVNLENFFVFNNNLTTLPHQILTLNLEWRLDFEDFQPGLVLGGNPFTEPPVEIVRQGREAARAWFEAREEDVLLPVREVKALLVGEGSAGKTCLWKRIIHDEFDQNESRTHGINITPWPIERDDGNIQMHFWDFGGQDIMHATHQFFMSERSLYILLLDGRKGEDPEHWLHLIESLGGDSPILIILNKADEDCTYDLDREFLKKKYTGLKDFIRISCLTGEGINDVKNALKRYLTEVKMLNSEWPKRWFNVKQKLQTLDKPFISEKEFDLICGKRGINDNRARETLKNYMNDLGVALHFSDFNLCDKHILEPHWTTGGVYKILNAESLSKSHGMLRLATLKDILKKENVEDYDYTDHRRFLIDLMKKFELCYDLDTKKVLIPDLLEKSSPPFSFDYSHALKFHLDFSFIPPSIMPRFIVRMHSFIKEGLVWRTGLVLRSEELESEAEVRIDKDTRRIQIFIIGPMRREFLSIILYEFQALARDFKKLDVVERLCLPDMPGKTVSYQYLKDLIKQNVTECRPEAAGGKLYNVQKLLGIVVKSEPTEQEMLRILRALEARAKDEDDLVKLALSVIKPGIQLGAGSIGVNLVALKVLLYKLARKVFAGKKS